MRPAAVMKLLSVALVVVLAAAFAPAAKADVADCIQACVDQFDADRLACDDELAVRLADLDQQAAECLEIPNPIEAGLCMRDVNIARYNAMADHRRCVSIANTVAYNCYRDCQSSPSAP